MTRDSINVQYPTIEDSQSVGAAKLTKSVVDVENGVTVANAFANKNNTLTIFVENTADEDSTVTFKAGDTYPNSMLGDLQITVEDESVTAFQIQDISRFENKDGSLKIDFGADFEGNIYAVAKPVALNV
ncbi:MAG: hypothetical protein K6E29_00780 [Cyanobacteria bacterium RUI128]|nr:hypothetical protein [Cyanobacteria bacterium RUI128]